MAPAEGSTGSLIAGTANSYPEELANHPRYELLQVVGSGGMGTVYKARHRFMDRIVALKVVHPRLLNRLDVVARFEGEIRLAARLHHPNIVISYDAEAYGPLHFLVMEFINGRNLADLLAAEGPLSLERACDYAYQTAVGLQYAFEQGMIHRDIKPHNLITTGGGPGSTSEVVKILDFGLARLLQEMPPRESGLDVPSSSQQNTTLTDVGAVVGTWNYMAPEQADNAAGSDIRADIYALGCTLYHLLAGYPPFGGRTPEQKRQLHRAGNARPLSQARSDIPRELDAVVAKMMAKHPAQRYQTPAEAAQALAPWRRTSQASLLPTRTATSDTVGRTLTRRRFLRTGAAVSLVGGTASVVAYRYLGSSKPSVPSSTGRSFYPQAGPQVARLQGQRNPIFSLTFSGDGQVLASGNRKGEIVLWDRIKQRPRQEHFLGHEGKVGGLGFAKQQQHLLSAAEDGTWRTWDLATGRTITEVRTQPRDKLTSMALSFAQGLILCGGTNHTWLWHLHTGEPVRRLPQSAECVAFSPDGLRFATGGWDKQIRIWDTTSGGLLATLTAHTMGIKGIDFSSDGRRILSVGEDRRICLWDATTYTMQRDWQGHKHWIWSVHFLPDGERALTSSWDRTMRLWDLPSGHEIKRFTSEPESEEFCCEALSPDGHWAACAGADGIIYLWELPD